MATTDAMEAAGLGGSVVSVVVPVHNVAAFLDNCLASIIAQTHSELDVVVVNDGSSDDSPSICDMWALRDSRVRVIHTPALGTSAARNTGLDHARAKYVMFVDSDDVIAPLLVSTLLKLLAEAAADVATCDSASFVGNDPPAFREATAPALVESADGAAVRIIRTSPRWEVWGKLYRAHVWDGVRFPAGLVHQDLHAMPRVLANAGRVVSTDAVLYGYRMRAGSIMDTTRVGQLSPDLLTILEGNLALARARSVDRSEFDAWSGTYLLHATKQLERLDTHVAWQRNAEFRQAYTVFARRHRADMWRNQHVSVPYRVLWLVSSASPRAFRELYRVGRWGKKNGIRGLRRGRSGGAGRDT